MFKGKAKVANPRKYNNAIVNKVHDMHHNSERSTFLGIKHGKTRTTVDKEAVQATALVAGGAVLIGGLSLKLPACVQVVWHMLKPTPKSDTDGDGSSDT